MTTDLFGPSPSTLSSTAAPKRHGRRLLTLGFVASTAAALLVGGMGGTASAAPPGESTQAQVNVGSGITLSGLAATFQLTGAPGETPTGGPGAFNVITNADAGYAVTVLATATTLVGTNLNTDTIPIGTLKVQSADNTLTSVSGTAGGEVTIANHPGSRSIATGDLINKTYSMLLPAVATDQYTVTLNYVASILGG